MQHLKSQVWVSAVALSSVLLFTACQPKNDTTSKTEAGQVATSSVADIPVVQAKVVPVELAQKQVCDEEGCTAYDIQTVKSNVAWIDNYFMQRLQKADPIAFSKSAASAATPEEETNPMDLNQSSSYVRYIGQHGNLATFSLQSYYYPARAAHGMHHQEFVTFDLKQQKRLALQDILLPNAEAKVVEELFNHNFNWLDEHDISREKFKLSDNFYYGANGIVFVYPLYELASYAEGMPELVLPYYATAQLIKPEYLPSLPQYPNQ
ncbi:RsiV family protein [Acinetobacter sp. A2]|uniref:RsiV family protein n=1 Tax=Acinetobacter sp. A2 TaxID=362457 RepID=UPI003AF3999E